MNLKLHRLFFISIFFALRFSVAAQINGIDTSITLDVLVAPNSPAFTLLGINPTTIDKPSTPTDFAFSLANATNNFSGLPKNYAVEFLPVPLLFSKCKASKDLFNTKLTSTLAQTFSISAGFSTSDTVNTSRPNFIATKCGLGFKVSILRGKIDSTFIDYKNDIKNVRDKLSALHALNVTEMNHIRETDLVYLLLHEKKETLANELKAMAKDSSLSEAKIDARTKEIAMMDAVLNANLEDRLNEIKIQQIAKEKAIVEAAAQMKEKIENIKFRRYGVMLDVAGGMVLGFRNNDFQNSVVQQYAFWLNGGWSGKKGLDALALARYNTNVGVKMNLDSTFSDQSSFDIGGKIEFTTAEKRFSIGAEGIMRFVSDTSIFRYTFNTSYQVKKNQALTLSVGKDFAETKAKLGGSLIATLNYILAFGSTRKISLADLEKE